MGPIEIGRRGGSFIGPGWFCRAFGFVPSRVTLEPVGGGRVEVEGTGSGLGVVSIEIEVERVSKDTKKTVSAR